MNEELTFKTVDGFSISAVHTVCDAAKGVVLWLHGISVDKNEYLGLFSDGAAYLENRDIDSLRMDFRGHGESSGTSLDFSIAGQMLDLEAAIEFLVSYYEQSAVPIHIVACSFGAPPAIFMAARRREIAKLVLIAPVLSYMRTFLEPETEWGKELFNAKRLAKAAKTNRLYIDPKFPISMRLIEEMMIVRPDIALAELRRPTVVVHGDADSMVPFNVSKAVVKRARCARLKRFRDMDHGFNDVKDEKGTSDRSLKNKCRIFKIIKRQLK